jgi:hypothetical protein
MRQAQLKLSPIRGSRANIFKNFGDRCSSEDKMSGEDDDPVVREIPVMIATELSEVLYLIQHPLFNKKRVDADANSTDFGEPPLPASAKIRPRHGIELQRVIIQIFVIYTQLRECFSVSLSVKGNSS